MKDNNAPKKEILILLGLALVMLSNFIASISKIIKNRFFLEVPSRDIILLLLTLIVLMIILSQINKKKNLIYLYYGLSFIFAVFIEAYLQIAYIGISFWAILPFLFKKINLDKKILFSQVIVLLSIAYPCLTFMIKTINNFFEYGSYNILTYQIANNFLSYGYSNGFIPFVFENKLIFCLLMWLVIIYKISIPFALLRLKRFEIVGFLSILISLYDFIIVGSESFYYLPTVLVLFIFPVVIEKLSIFEEVKN